MIEKIVEQITGFSAEELRKRAEDGMKANADFQQNVIKLLGEIRDELIDIKGLLAIIADIHDKSQKDDNPVYDLVGEIVQEVKKDGEKKEKN